MSKASKVRRAKQRAQSYLEFLNYIKTTGQQVDAEQLAKGLTPEELSERHAKAQAYLDRERYGGEARAFIAMNVIRIVRGMEPLQRRTARPLTAANDKRRSTVLRQGRATLRRALDAGR